MDAKAVNLKTSANLYWQSEGTGPDLVLLHGWGMNGAVWQQTVAQLATQFRVHTVDLPGYGFSEFYDAVQLTEIADLLLQQAPEKAIWLGWSLGGLVAIQIALQAPARVSHLITLASSPKFAASQGWRGIQPQVLDAFTQQLTDDFQQTIERFMALQAMGSPSARQDVKQIKQVVLSRPQPNPQALQVGLDLLAQVDLRTELANLSMPVLRLYGRLDGLVPVKIATQLTKPVHDRVYIFAQSAHAPFMSELDAFCQQIIQFVSKG